MKTRTANLRKSKENDFEEIETANRHFHKRRNKHAVSSIDASLDEANYYRFKQCQRRSLMLL